ncbi:MAG: hypothetical protein HYR60_16445 [Acidobacteria bacterium]|nr:hypothetical protein [Acidobacteriota bacterium]
MRLLLRWSRAIPHPDTRLARFIRVLLSAWRTPRYRTVLEAAGLDSPDQIDRIESIEETLARLPKLELAEYRAGGAGFSNPDAPEPAPNRLQYPRQPPPRTALFPPRAEFMPRFESRGPVRVFLEEEMPYLGRLGPEALAAPVSLLVAMAQLVDSGILFLRPLTHYLVAFTGVGEDLLDDESRELLWQVFQVPVFEQFLGADGRVLAGECEAHEGLHLNPDNAVFERDSGSGLLLTSLTALRRPALRLETGMAGRIEPASCGCGVSSPRLMDLQRAPCPVAQAMAAGE